MNDNSAVDRVVKELYKLLEAAANQEERNKIWAEFFECIHEVFDDEEWAAFIKPVRAEVAKRNAH